MSALSPNHRWWQTEIVYQVYPRSFQDSNGDGIGDIPGIIQRLDYLSSLRVGAIWLSPIFPSPMHDFGYDVSDYLGIHQIFGTMGDFDRLLESAHGHGFKLLLDLVPNHSSDQHPWFIESRSSRDNPKRDWYIWRDPAPDGGPPNNWLSVFGGPAWTLDPTTGQYYLHQFVTQQPELNYRNPDVLEAMLDVMRFWLDKGVDGFRVDVITRLIKDEQLRDEPPAPNWDGIDPYYSLDHIYTKNIRETHDVVRRMRALIDGYGDRVMIGETYLPNEELAEYYGPQMDECHLPFNFQLIKMEWRAGTVRRAVDAYEATLPDGSWPNWVLGNHDRHRVASRVGPRQARVANMMLLTLRGTPTTYYGEELGMEDVPIPREMVMDPPAVNQPEIADVVGRDPVRTPMQWNDEPNGGFARSGVTPWLPLAEDFRERNVLRQETDPTSMLTLYRRLATLRQSELSMHAGSYASVDTAEEEIFAYRRDYPGADSFLIVLNFGSREYSLDLSHAGTAAEVAITTHVDRSGDVEIASLYVAPDEGLVLRLPADGKQS